MRRLYQLYYPVRCIYDLDEDYHALICSSRCYNLNMMEGSIIRFNNTLIPSLPWCPEMLWPFRHPDHSRGAFLGEFSSPTCRVLTLPTCLHPRWYIHNTCHCGPRAITSRIALPVILVPSHCRPPHCPHAVVVSYSSESSAQTLCSLIHLMPAYARIEHESHA